MQGFRNYGIDGHMQGRDQQQIVVDLLPSQYTKPATPPLSPQGKLSPRAFALFPLNALLGAFTWDFFTGLTLPSRFPFDLRI